MTLRDPTSQYLPPHGYWKHVKTQQRYEIISFAIEERTMIPIVVYRSEEFRNTTWTRPCSEFFEVARFVQDN
jgi:hypothetical protein